MAAIAYPELPNPIPLRLLPAGPAGRIPSRAAVYRRRRLGVLAVLAVVAIGLVLLLEAALGMIAAPARGSVRAGVRNPAATVLVTDLGALASGADVPEGARYIVQPGDTLWSIARTMAPQADVAATVERLADLNGSSAVQAGQRIRLR